MATGVVGIALAGGAFPGGMFGIGVLERLAEEAVIAQVTGASSGAINALLVANGRAQDGVEVWREVLGSMPKVGIGRVQTPVFDAIRKYASLEKFIESGVHTRIIYNKIGFLATKGEKVHLHEHLIHVFSCKVPFPSRRGILDNRADYGLTKAEFVTKVQASCSLPPFYLRATKFAGEGIINDGYLVDELGGADLLVKDASLEQDVSVLVITRYPPGSKKHQGRQEKLHGLCSQYGLPVERAVLVAPETGLPVKSNYVNDMAELNQCYQLGKQAAVQALRKL